MNDHNILLSGARDLYSLCEKRGSAVFSRFYDGGEQAALFDGRMILPFAMLFGGHENSERKILGVFPDWEEPDTSSFPINIIKITNSFKKTFSHRDVLGSLMGLGIERDRIGDIIVADDGAYVFLHQSVTEYVLSTLKKIGSHGVKVSLADREEFVFPEPKFAIISSIAASQRLDAIVAASVNISRSKAASLIHHELVSINHRPTQDLSASVAEGDLLSIRGFGRFSVDKISGQTRSGRLHISIKKYL